MKPQRKSVIDLEPHIGKYLLVQFSEGRELCGKLIVVDNVTNIILDDTIEYMHQIDDFNKRIVNEEGEFLVRRLGRVIGKGSAISHVQRFRHSVIEEKIELPKVEVLEGEEEGEKVPEEEEEEESDDDDDDSEVIKPIMFGVLPDEDD